MHTQSQLARFQQCTLILQNFLYSVSNLGFPHVAQQLYDKSRHPCKSHFTRRSHTGIMSFLKVLSVLVLYLTVADCLTQLTLRCMGDKSKLTSTDCQRLGDKPGCYWLEDFNQYRSCGSLCNDVKANSLREMKCKAYCEGKIQG